MGVSGPCSLTLGERGGGGGGGGGGKGVEGWSLEWNRDGYQWGCEHTVCPTLYHAIDTNHNCFN